MTLNPVFKTNQITLYSGDVFDILPQMPDESVDLCLTSPPYFGLRNYGVEGQIGLEPTLKEYIDKLVLVFREVRRILKPSGVLLLNLGDSYAGSSMTGGNAGINAQGGVDGFTQRRQFKKVQKLDGFKSKDLMMVPHRVAIALQDDGWYVRQDIVWHKPNPMPESVTDRCTKSHEYIFHLTKNERYYWNADAIKEPAKWERWGGQTENKTHQGTAKHLGNKKINELPIKDDKNARSVWSITTKPYPEAHFATFPPELAKRGILAGCPKCGTVLDPFAGSGTTLNEAKDLGRIAIGVELNPEYCKLIEKRCRQLSIFDAAI